MTNAVPTFSVVIPLYDKERHVGRAIDSVLKQSFQDFEIVVVDDGSKDGGPQIVESLRDARIRLIRQPNGGVSAARNRGIAESRSDLVGFLDADDAYDPDFLQNVRVLQQRYPHAGAYAFNFARRDALGNTVPAVTASSEVDGLLSPEAFFALAKVGVPVHPSALVVKKTAFSVAGVFPVGMTLGEDIDTCLRLCFASSIAFDHRIGATYFLDADHRALNRHPPELEPTFFATIDGWLATQSTVSRTTLGDVEEFKNYFRLAHAHHQIRWGSRMVGRNVLLRCRTKIHLAWKWRWILISFLPRRVYAAIVSLKAATFGLLRGRTKRFAM